ncbi:MAG: hypothetical protein ACOX19_05745 [Fermentimonas sp.]|jgi:hypothetical protein
MEKAALIEQLENTASNLLPVMYQLESLMDLAEFFSDDEENEDFIKLKFMAELAVEKLDSERKQIYGFIKTIKN